MLSDPPPKLELERECSLLRHENGYLRARLAEVDRKVTPELGPDVSGQQRQRVIAERNELNRQCAEVTSQLAVLRKQLGIIRQERDRLEDEMEKAVAERDARSAELVDVEAKLKDVVILLESEQEKADRRSKLLVEMEKQVQTLTDERDSQRLSLQRLAGAEHELGRLLDRFARTPLRIVFRRWSGYRRLEEEWRPGGPG